MLYFLLAQIFEIESSIPKSVDAHLNKNEIYVLLFSGIQNVNTKEYQNRKQFWEY